MNHLAPRTRRIGILAVTAFGLGTLGAAGHAVADPAVEVPVNDEYWACIAIDHVEIGTCVENPLPDLGEAQTIEDVVEALLAG